jgi:hypothetical protein
VRSDIANIADYFKRKVLYRQNKVTVKSKENVGKQRWIRINPQKLIAGIFCRPMSAQLE